MLRILVADDEKMECEALKDILTHAYGTQIELHFAYNGTEALAKALETRAEIILMDIKMPGMSGLDASKEILRQMPQCRIIIHTGYTYFSYAKECVKIGACDLIVKPCAREEIIAVVDREIETVMRYRREQLSSRSHEQHLSIARGYAKREIVASIVYSNADEDEIQAYLNMLDTSFKSAVACVIHCEGGDSRKKQTAFEMIAAQMKGETRALSCYHMRNTKVYCLLFETQGKEALSAAVDDLERCCEAEKDLWFSRSAPLAQLSDIFGAFSMLRLVSRADRDNGSALSSRSRYQIEEKMCQDLRGKRVLDAMRSLEVLMDHIALTGENLAQQYFELLLLLQRSMHDREGIPSVYPLYPQLAACVEIPAFKHVVTEYAEQLIDRLTGEEDERKKEWVEECRAYIGERFCQELTLDETAQAFSYSPYYFSKLFKREFKMTFIDYLTHLRIEKAKALLGEGQLTIREISDTVGFAEQNYFTRVFKRETGMTPSAYQKNANETNM